VQWGTGSFDEMGSVNFLMVPVSNEVDAEQQQRIAAAIKGAIEKVAASDAMKRYAAEQKRFLEDPSREGAIDPCKDR
jgi:hypothetical protein